MSFLHAEPLRDFHISQNQWWKSSLDLISHPVVTSSHPSTPAGGRAGCFPTDFLFTLRHHLPTLSSAPVRGRGISHSDLPFTVWHHLFLLLPPLQHTRSNTILVKGFALAPSEKHSSPQDDVISSAPLNTYASVPFSLKPGLATLSNLTTKPFVAKASLSSSLISSF